MAEPRKQDRVAELFHRAVRLDAAERAAFVRSEAGSDAALRDEVLALLQADRTCTQDALRSPVAGGAPAVIGEVLGRYRLIEELGEGGMGRVYRAEQLAPVRREVAVKVMRRTGLAAAAGRARFEAEQRALVRLEHANLARVLDGGYAADGRPFLVMELVRGAPLDQWLAAAKPPLGARLDVFLGVCEAIQHAHQKGVIHRDLKPSNVLVATDDAGVPTPRVIDFGIARVLATDDGEETLHTQHDVAMGTVGYMSPEQARDAASADARSDVYALGVLLYQLLTGQPPRQPDGVPPLRPSSCAGALPDAPADLDLVVLRALEQEPERRYATVHEFAVDIDRARRGLPVSARAPTLWYLATRFLRRHRVSMSLAGAALLGLVLAVVGLFALWNEADRNWNDYRRLVDDKRMNDLRVEARDSLWPPWPAIEPAMAAWQRRAEALLARRADLHRRAAELDLRVERERDASVREELRFQQEVWTRLLAGLDHLGSDEPADDNIAGVVMRRREAARVGRLSLVEAADAWREAIAAISDPRRAPAYDGLVLPGPQVGLVPLGQAPDSGLWEFWHVESGQRPELLRTDDGGYGGVRVTPESGMVFVLVPGGRFTIGALTVGDEHSGTAPIDPDAAPMETFVHDITLQAFFVSKFECTQGQWYRLTGERPSFTSPGRTRDRQRGHVPDDRWPVEQVTWYEADRTLRRRGLLLPTEAQWEYVARAGTRTRFGCVDDERELDRHANLADAGSDGVLRALTESGLDDGHALQAPVGSFRANAWGLYDCHGNVAEWCRDWLVSYTRPAAAGDALRLPGDGDAPSLRCTRGGDFAERKRFSRVASRNGQPPDQRTARTGVRAVRSILP